MAVWSEEIVDRLIIMIHAIPALYDITEKHQATLLRLLCSLLVFQTF